MRQHLALLCLLLCLSVANVASAGSWSEDSERAEKCFDSVNRDPAFAVIARKLSFFGSPSLEQLSNDEYATEHEVAVIKIRNDRLQPCRDLMVAALKAHHPYTVSAYELLYFQYDMVYLRLAKRHVTFGEATRLYHEAWLEFAAKRERYAQELNDQQRQSELERDRRLADQARRWRDSIDRDYPPGKITTCSWNASMLVCM